MRTLKASLTSPVPSSSPTSHLRSPWHSPVPYLFGGLAAMLGLIAFALLILACSYWRLSGRIDSGDDVESGNGKEGSSEKVDSEKVYEEKVLVIMAGEDKPTYLATPLTCKSVLFSDKNQKVESEEGDDKKEMDCNNKGKEDLHGGHETTVVLVHENGDDDDDQETTQQQNH